MGRRRLNESFVCHNVVGVRIQVSLGEGRVDQVNSWRGVSIRKKRGNTHPPNAFAPRCDVPPAEGGMRTQYVQNLEPFQLECVCFFLFFVF